MKATHIANPVCVNARRILQVHAPLSDGHVPVSMEDGQSQLSLSPEMVSRHTPVAGDYIVTQEDGYVYVNPKGVFERKYSLITE